MSERVMFRKATRADIPALRAMHRASLYALGRAHYSEAALEGLLTDVETADPTLIADGTYALAEIDGVVAASGGWTLRRPRYAAPSSAGPDGSTATIRAVFTHPGYARRGLGRAIMELCETEAAILGGAERLELSATLVGVPLYERLGWSKREAFTLALSNGARFAGWRMTKEAEHGRLRTAA